MSLFLPPPHLSFSTPESASVVVPDSVYCGTTLSLYLVLVSWTCARFVVVESCMSLNREDPLVRGNTTTRSTSHSLLLGSVPLSTSMHMITTYMISPTGWKWVVFICVSSLSVYSNGHYRIDRDS